MASVPDNRYGLKIEMIIPGAYANRSLEYEKKTIWQRKKLLIINKRESTQFLIERSKCHSILLFI